MSQPPDYGGIRGPKPDSFGILGIGYPGSVVFASLAGDGGMARRGNDADSLFCGCSGMRSDVAWVSCQRSHPCSLQQQAAGNFATRIDSFVLLGAGHKFLDFAVSM